MSSLQETLFDQRGKVSFGYFFRVEQAEEPDEFGRRSGFKFAEAYDHRPKLVLPWAWSEFVQHGDNVGR